MSWQHLFSGLYDLEKQAKIEKAKRIQRTVADQAHWKEYESRVINVCQTFADSMNWRIKRNKEDAGVFDITDKHREIRIYFRPFYTTSGTTDGPSDHPCVIAECRGEMYCSTLPLSEFTEIKLANMLRDCFIHFVKTENQ